MYIDFEELKNRIQKMLWGKQQVSLKEVVAYVLVEKGFSEIVVYFGLVMQWEFY